MSDEVKLWLPSELVWGVSEVDGEKNVFWVQSKSKAGNQYKVDLQDYGGNGSCQCKGFLDFGKAGKLERGAKPNNKFTMCEHIRRAREFYTWRELNFDIVESQSKITRERFGRPIVAGVKREIGGREDNEIL